MRKLVIISFLTLDGVMQAPGAKDEDTEGGFKYGGWQIPFFEDVDVMSDYLGNVGALLLGRKTYEIFAAYWPTVGKNIEPYGPFMNNITKYVASKTLNKVEWQNSNLLEGEVSKAVAALKKEDGKNIVVFGSGDLSQTLMRENLVDEYSLMIYPLILGSGKRLFQQHGAKKDLELLNSKKTKNGVVVVNYRVKK